MTFKTRDRLERLGLAGGFLFLGCVTLAVIVDLAWAATLNLIDFTSGMSGTTVFNTLNTNGDRLEAVINGGLDQTNFAPTFIIPAGAVADGSITLAKLAANSVDSSKVVDASVVTADLGLLSVTQGVLALNSVGSPQIIDGTIVAADLAASVISQAQGNRATYVAETGLQADVSFTNYLRTRYTSGAVVNDVPKDMTYCNGFIYVAVDDTAAGDFVTKITASTMAASASIALVAGDNPVDLECGLDGSVYVLNGGTFTVKKIATNDAVTTVGSVTGADAVAVMAGDPNTTNLYIVGSTGASGRNQTLFRMVVSTGSVSSVDEPGADPDNHFNDVLWYNKNGVERIAVLRSDDSGASNECFIVTYSNAAPPAIDENFEVDDTDGATDADHCQSFEFDGSYVLVPLALGGAADITGFAVVDMGASARVHPANTNKIGVSAGDEPDGAPQSSFFDGHHFIWQQADGLVNMLAPPYYTTGGRIEGIDMDAGMTGTLSPCGLASDGTSFWVCTRNTANTEYIVTKQLGI